LSSHLRDKTLASSRPGTKGSRTSGEAACLRGCSRLARKMIRDRHRASEDPIEGRWSRRTDPEAMFSDQNHSRATLRLRSMGLGGKVEIGS
jgi:hypothetical protein